MASTPPTTVAAYLKSLPADRRAAIEAIREVVNANIDPRFEEGIQYGMIGWYLPHSEYPDGYHCDPKQPLPFASVASQKSHIGLYLFCIYTSEDEKARFVEEWKATGKRLDMGKSCVRVKKLDDLPLEVLGRAFRRIRAKDFVASYEAARDGAWKRGASKRRATKKTAKKPAKRRAKKAATKKAAKKATTKKKSTKKRVAKKTATRKKVATRKKTATRKKVGTKRGARRA